MRGRLTGIALLTVASLLSACSSSSSSSQPHAVRSVEPCFGCNGTPFEQGPSVIDGARAGGTVTVLTHDGLAGTLDPSAVSRPDLLSIDSGLLTRSLTQYRYDRDTHQMMLVPDLATELGYHNDHYTRWSFTIRPGARFEDGQHVTAADVVRGVHRCLRAASSPTGPCHDLGPALTDVTSGPGRHSSVVTFSFKRPFPDLPYVAAFPELGPLPAGRSHDPATYRLHPLATGPYMVDRYTPSKRLVLVRNPEWDTQTDPARTQYPERYVFRSGVPARAIDRRLVSGTEPTTLTYDDVRRPDLAAVQSSDQAGLVVGGRQCLTYWAPDNRVVTDRRVRLALAWAFPYRAFLRIQGLVPGVTADPTTSLQPPGLPGRTPYRVDGRRPFQTSPARARHLLEQADALGRPLSFVWSPGDPVSRRTKHALVRALRAAGFTPHPERAETRSSARGRPVQPVDVRTATWCSGYPWGRAFLPPLIGTQPRPKDGAGSNLSAFAQPSVNRRIRAIRRMPLAEQARAYGRLDRWVMQRWFPMVPIAYPEVAMAHGARVEGMVDDAIHGMPDWKGLWVTP